MPYANLMRILYMARILNDADPVSRRPDFYTIDKLYKPDLNLWWDGNVLDIIDNGSDHALLALSTLRNIEC